MTAANQTRPWGYVGRIGRQWIVRRGRLVVRVPIRERVSRGDAQEKLVCALVESGALRRA